MKEVREKLEGVATEALKEMLRTKAGSKSKGDDKYTELAEAFAGTLRKAGVAVNLDTVTAFRDGFAFRESFDGTGNAHLLAFGVMTAFICDLRAAKKPRAKKVAKKSSKK